jgi:hypothetical protein
MSNEKHLIKLVESGGVTGVIRHYQCAVSDLPLKQNRQLQAALSQVKPPTDQLVRDELVYLMTVIDDQQSQQYQLNPRANPAHAELIASIRRQAHKNVKDEQ